MLLATLGMFAAALPSQGVADSPQAKKSKEHRESMREQWRGRSDEEREVLRDVVRERSEEGGSPGRRLPENPDLSPEEREKLRQDIRDANRSLRRDRK